MENSHKVLYTSENNYEDDIVVGGSSSEVAVWCYK